LVHATNHLPLETNNVPSTHPLALHHSPKIGLVPRARELNHTKLSRQRVHGGNVGIRSFGTSFQVWANQADLLEQALIHLPLGCERASASPESPQYSLIRTAGVGYRLERDGRQIFKCTDRVELLDRFRSVIALNVADTSPLYTFVHAGVVAWGHHAILIPGRSFAGKSTLVAELVRAGATYYSDEFALLDRQGRVHPYAQPLQMREDGSDRQTERPVEEFGGIAGQKPLSVRLVLVSKYQPGAQWSPRQLTPGVGLLRLLDNTVSARRAPAAAICTLKQVVSYAVIVRGVRGEASQIAQWIGAHFPSPQTPDETSE
jgi:hypothetical protein